MDFDGSRIKDLRAEAGYSQTQFAALLHVTQSAVSQWEKGRTVPDTEMLKRIASALGVTVDSLWSGEIERQQAEQQPFAPEEMEVIRMYRMLNAENRKNVLALLRSLSASPAAQRGAYQKKMG